MQYQVKRWKTARGFYYILLEGGKSKVNGFVKELLSKIDPSTLKAEEKELKKRKDERAMFIEGPNLTIVMLDNHVFIKPENDEQVLEIIQNMIELPNFKKKK
jgi:hypothetical protein